MNILVVGPPRNPHLQRFTFIAAKSGINTTSIDSSQATDWCWNENGVHCDSHNIGTDAVDAAYVFQRPPTFPVKACFDSQTEKTLSWDDWYYLYFRQKDRYDSLLSWLFYLESLGKPICNPQSKILFSEQKPYQLAIMKQLGCPLPETSITNNPTEAKNFIRRYKDVITKPVAGGALTLAANELSDDQLNKVKMAPAIFQRRIFGTDIRVIVIDGECVSAAAIEVPEGTLDFRAHGQYQAGRISYQNVVLPAQIKIYCKSVCSALGFGFAGIDIKMTKDKQFYFLELNSSPNYLDVERKLGHPITEQLIAALARNACKNNAMSMTYY